MGMPGRETRALTGEVDLKGPFFHVCLAARPAKNVRTRRQRAMRYGENTGENVDILKQGVWVGRECGVVVAVGEERMRSG